MTRPINPKIIALYLPQFHPIAENDAWWGPGFTEWHNVAKARPLFRGHMQPVLPGELGFYDLRLAETRADQARLAREAGVHGFCYWHYWFAGRRLLERPMAEILADQAPDLPFCIGWANETWTGIWHGTPGKILIEQTYPEGDAERHYALLRQFFHDPRYIRHQGRPFFYIYKPKALPSGYLAELRRLAVADGFPDLHITGTWTPNPGGSFDSATALDLDAAVVTNISGRDSLSKAHLVESVRQKLLGWLKVASGPRRLPYAKAVKAMLPTADRFDFPIYNTVISNWDNTPRSGRRGLVLEGCSPDQFQGVVEQALDNLTVAAPEQTPGDFVFLKSWNEWAEGNYVEPDQAHKHGWLDAIRHALSKHVADAKQKGG